jgi:hypothetical protein
VFLLLGYGFFYPDATFRTKAMTFPQPRATLIAGKFYPCFKVLDCNGTSAKINITYGDTECLGHATPKVKQQMDKKSISQVLSGLFQFLYF